MTDPVLDGIVKEMQNTSAKTWGYSQTNSLALRMSLKRAFGDSQAKPSSPATTGTPAVQQASLGSASTETLAVKAPSPDTAKTETPVVQAPLPGTEDGSLVTPVVHADKKMDLEAELKAFKKRELEAAAEPASKRRKVGFQNSAALLECLYPLVDSRWFVLAATMGSWAKMPEKRFGVRLGDQEDIFEYRRRRFREGLEGCFAKTRNINVHYNKQLHFQAHAETNTQCRRSRTTKCTLERSRNMMNSRTLVQSWSLAAKRLKRAWLVAVFSVLCRRVSFCFFLALQATMGLVIFVGRM